MSNACGTIKKLGIEIRTRPFCYQDTSQGDLDSFLLFTSSFEPRVRHTVKVLEESFIHNAAVALVPYYLWYTGPYCMSTILVFHNATPLKPVLIGLAVLM